MVLRLNSGFAADFPYFSAKIAAAGKNCRLPLPPTRKYL
jgi:hypothetical protein